MSNPVFTSSIDNTIKREDICYFNGEPYVFELYFINSNSVRRIDQAVFVKLEITENCNTPFTKAVLTLKNNNNEIESYSVPGKYQEIENLWYSYKGDGSDCVFIKISTTFQSQNYTRTFLYVIDDETNTVSNNTPIKQYSLLDINYVNLKKNTKPWSTSFLIPNTRDISQLSDTDRSVYTGDALKHIIGTSLNPNLVDNERWDKGVTQVFYTSNNNTSRLQVLYDVLEDHVSLKNSDLCVLRYQQQKFNLTSLHQIFQTGLQFIGYGSNEEVIGTFLLNTQETGMNRAPIPGTTEIPVADYKFLNQSGTDGLYTFINQKIVRYDSCNKKFSIISKEGEIENVKKYIQQTYFPTRLNYNPNLNITPNTKKNVNYNTIYSTSTSQLSIDYLGRREIIKKLLTLSTTIELNCIGVLPVYTNKLINIKRLSNVDSKFEHLINGVWYVADYLHTFTPTQFHTNIVGTKIYTNE